MALMRLAAVTLMILVTLLSGFLTASYGYRGGRIVGAMTEIGDVKANTEVQELGRFSVEEYNQRVRLRGNQDGDGGEKLEFTKVVEAQKQVVSGIKYYLKIYVTQNGSYRMFDSVVVVKPWLHSKQLINFAPSYQKIEFAR